MILSGIHNMARLYSFTNMYLSDIQKGIQTAHLVQEINLKYALTSENRYNQDSLFRSWSLFEQTIIVLNGGNQENLTIIFDLFSNARNHYPFSSFKEDEKSLNGALTAVGIILPENFNDTEDRQERIIQGMTLHNGKPIPHLLMDAQLAELLMNSRLA
jgi:hypothetical protein